MTKQENKYNNRRDNEKNNKSSNSNLSSSNAVVENAINLNKEAENINTKKSSKIFEQLAKNIENFGKTVDELNKKFKNTNNDAKGLSSAVTSFSNYINLITAVSNFKIGSNLLTFRLKMKLLKSAANSIVSFINDEQFQNTLNLTNFQNLLKGFNNFISSITDIGESAKIKTILTAKLVIKKGFEIISCFNKKIQNFPKTSTHSFELISNLSGYISGFFGNIYSVFEKIPTVKDVILLKTRLKFYNPVLKSFQNILKDIKLIVSKIAKFPNSDKDKIESIADLTDHINIITNNLSRITPVKTAAARLGITLFGTLLNSLSLLLKTISIKFNIAFSIQSLLALKRLMMLSGGMVLFVGSLALMSGIIILTGPKILLGFAAFTVLTIALTAVLFIISKLSLLVVVGLPALTGLVGFVLLMSASLVAISLSVLAATKILNLLNHTEIQTALTSLKTTLHQIFDVFLSIGKSIITNITLIATVAAAVLAIGGILVIAAGLKLLSVIGNNIFEDSKTAVDNVIHSVDYIMDAISRDNSKNISQSNKKVSLFGKMVSGLFATGYMLTALIVTGSVVFIGGLLWTIQKINVPSKAVLKNKINDILSTVDYIQDCLSDYSSSVSNKPNTYYTRFEKFFSHTFGSVAKIVTGLLNVANIGLAMLNTGMIVFIAGLLKVITKIKFDKNQIRNRIKDIFGCLDYITDLLNSKRDLHKEDRKETFWDELGSFASNIIGGSANLITSLLNIPFLLSSCITLGCVMMVAKLLDKVVSNIPDNIDYVIEKIKSLIKGISDIRSLIGGSITGYLNDSNNRSSDGSMMSTIAGLFENTAIGKLIQSGKSIIGSFGWVMSSLVVLGMVGLVSKAVNNMSNTSFDPSKQIQFVRGVDKFMQQFAQLNLTASKNKSNTKVIKSFCESLKPLSEISISDTNINGLDRLCVSIKNFSSIKLDSNTEAIKQTIKYVDKVNSIDTKKIKSVTDMFEKMSKFSESIDGNFERLAEVLSNDLLEALEKLNNHLSGTATDYRNNSNIYDDISKPSSNSYKDSSGGSQQNLTSSADSIEKLHNTIKELKDSIEAMTNQTFTITPAIDSTFKVSTI